MTRTTNAPVPDRPPRDRTWRDRAACLSTEHRHVDPESFFPDPDAKADAICAATSLCRRCPVRRTCLEVALEDGDTYGIRGGLTEGERAPLHREFDIWPDRSLVDAVLAGRPEASIVRANCPFTRKDECVPGCTTPFTPRRDTDTPCDGLGCAG